MTINLTTPVGRLIQGNLYAPNTKDAAGQLLTYKKGPKIGQPRVEYYFAVAIPKGAETHWSQTEWGQKIHKHAQEEYPKGQWQRPDFSWKITDGDSTEYNQGTPPRRWCDMTGFAGHWVLKFSCGYFTKVFNRNGSAELVEPNAINLGDWVQVNINISANNSEHKPGMYLNPYYIAFTAPGERITLGPAPSAVGFGEAPLPPGVSLIPPAGLPGTDAQVFTTPSLSVPAVPAPTAAPYPQILTAPVVAPAPTPVRTMTALANGLTYEQYKGAGWTDEQMINAGVMQLV